ncbi:MAG: hypothetical protein II786_08355 [Muribaculaceae bacterium]|nr:hypothetical protein [Muribaculaceae bacterium]MBR3102019.1 hypothetical protein [Muribaculaceae bacterium]
MKKTLLLSVIALTAVIGAAAQNNGKSKWASEMLEAKHRMIIEEVQLTMTQQEQFMPLYEAMEKEIYQTNVEARNLATNIAKKSNPTDSEYLQAATALSNAKVKEGEIEAKYFKEFTKMLTKKQMFQLKQAEAKFTRSMLTRGKKPQGK